MLRRIFMLLILYTVNCAAFAQDPVFSQFYNSPLYLNPAFSGCGKNDLRLCLSSRLQWLSLPTPLQYHSVSIDKFSHKLNASAGLIMNRFNEGYLKTTHVSLIGAKSFGSNENACADWFLNFAIQLGFTRKNVDKSKLLFSDQIGQSGPTGLPSAVELYQYASRTYFDVSAGFLFTYRNWMVGTAGYHLSQPNNGLIGSTDQSRLPYRVTIHASYIYDQYATSEGMVVIKPTAIFQLQDVSRSLTIGSLFDLPDRFLEFGIWYRNNIGIINNHSLSIGVNIKLGRDKNYYHAEPSSRYRAGLSYDAELNRPGVRYTSGSTELGLLYEKNLNNDDVCPKPYGECETRFPWVFH